ncbi:hypothetical protein ACFORH_12375 [Amycolatopsis roodepoortensis]|uniref:DUF559 domain-containing protein n=1 Tax=Amycolatopsis roodepoortensis TaxID=700274 RepID=A0ABR9L0A1_9PSEU|nr:hypothetical protein [Amycolatopsis roodepoortensis]MBE1574013.1 hypothetical protein [Amycolatopsis roodepoortensis]
MMSGPAVAAVKRLEALGVPRRTVWRRCEPGGVWRMLLPGVVLLGNGEPTDEQRIEASLVFAREGAVLTGVPALRRYGMRRLPDTKEVHVLVPAERAISSTGFVHVERTRRLPTPLNRAGVPTAPVPRAVIDAARRTPDSDSIVAMMAEAVQERHCLSRALAVEIDERSRFDGRLLRALVPILGGAHSVAEADAWHLWRRSGLPEFRWNVKVFDAAGRFVAKPDGWCDEIGFAWEIDSLRYHADGDRFRATLARNARYAAAGIVVLQTLPSRLRTEPDAVLEELKAAFGSAQQRPRPDVRLG